VAEMFSEPKRNEIYLRHTPSTDFSMTGRPLTPNDENGLLSRTARTRT
jgi:hypothetical protein